MPHAIDVIGVGSPLVDSLAQVDDAFIRHLDGAKGGMELVSAPIMQVLLSRLPAPPKRAPGGSAANTVVGLAHLGSRTRLLGKVGRDETGAFYRQAAAAAGVDLACLKECATTPTGQCLSLITPDSQRTMRTFLGASQMISLAEVTPADFAGGRMAHIEGYLLFNRELAEHVLHCAKTAGCTVSLDLASFEVVRAHREHLDELLNRYVDIVFANQDEAREYLGHEAPQAALAALARHCHVAAVKVGADGAWLQSGREQVFVSAQKVTAVDTTGAGDLWAAGFLHGWLRGRDLATCGRYGAALGAAVVQVVGAVIPDEQWLNLKETVR